MKIGLLIYGSLDTLSGGYFYDRKLVESLREQGDEVSIISLRWRNYAAHLSDNLAFKLPRGLDVLIQDELNHPSLIGANCAPRPYPVVSLVHHLRCSELRPTWQNHFYRVIERTYLQSADGFIFNSKTTQKAVEEIIKNKKPFAIGYPPTDRFGEGVAEDKILARARQEPFQILFLGNVMRRKGLHTLLNALRRLPAARFTLNVVGSLQVEPEYARQMRRLAPPNVRFHGALNNETLAAQLQQAHLLAVPSSYEGFGIVYLEGMGFGLPAIGTTSGAASEIIQDGETGFLIPPEDSAALAAQLQRAAEDRTLLTKLSLNALARYRLQPTWNETAANIRDFLQSLIV
ncbi:MAG: hypothetical protein Fur002_19500 [Anaerolineales bacterium]